MTIECVLYFVSASCRRHGILFTPYSSAVWGVPDCRLGRACCRHATDVCDVSCHRHAGHYGWCVEPHTMACGVNGMSCLRHGRVQEVCYRCVRMQWLWSVILCRVGTAWPSDRCGADWMMVSGARAGGTLYPHVMCRATGTQVTMASVSSPTLWRVGYIGGRVFDTGG